MTWSVLSGQSERSVCPNYFCEPPSCQCQCQKLISKSEPTRHKTFRAQREKLSKWTKLRKKFNKVFEDFAKLACKENQKVVQKFVSWAELSMIKNLWTTVILIVVNLTNTQHTAIQNWRPVWIYYTTYLLAHVPRWMWFSVLVCTRIILLIIPKHSLRKLHRKMIAVK